MKNILVRKQESRPFPSAESPHGNRPWAILIPTRRCLTLSTIFPRGQPSRSQGPGVTSSSWATHLRAPPHLRLQEPPPLLLLRVQAPLPLRPFILVGGSCSATPPPLGLPVAATARPPRGSAAAPPARPPAAVAPPLRLPQLPVPHLPVQDPAPRYSPSSPPPPVRLMVAEPWCTIPPAAAPGSGCAVATHCTVKWLVIFGHNLQSNLIFVI